MRRLLSFVAVVAAAAAGSGVAGAQGLVDPAVEKKIDALLAQMTLEEGRVTSCIARIEPRPESWVLGTASAWLDAVIGRDADMLEFGGDGDLGRDIVHGLHDALFGQFALTGT